MSFITTNPNPFIINLPSFQNVANSATGVGGGANLLDTTTATLQINTIQSYNNANSITINNNTNYANATISMNGTTLLTSNTLNGNNTMAFQINSVERARITPIGLGIQTTNPSMSLDVLGDSIIRGNLYVVNSSTTTTKGNITIDGNLQAAGVTYVSDSRLKKNVRPYTANRLPQAVEFEWISNGKRDVGVIASDVLNIEPACVHTTSNGYKSVDYSKLVVLCLSELSILRKEVTSLTQKIQELTAKQSELRQ